MNRGAFITFEGSEGCGKSTQILLLAGKLSGAGREPVLVREPGGTPLGEAVRELLKFASAGHGMSAESELLLFAASRAQVVREVIAPALEQGRTVLCDRFIDSTLVYQGAARGLDLEAVRAINRFATGGVVPDVTFLFDMDADAAFSRAMRRPRPADRPDRMEQEPIAFYRAVREGYLRLAQQEPERICVLDATLPREQLAQEMQQHLRSRIDGIFP